MPPLPKLQATIYFASGAALPVQETVDVVTGQQGWPAPGTWRVTRQDGGKVWVNVFNIERIEPLP